MTNKPRKIGTQFTADVVAYLRTDGFPHAELRNQAGANDLGDIVGMLGVVIECKGGKAAEDASDGQIAAWLMETERERRNARADVALLVTKRRAIGARRASQWWAHTNLATVLDLAGHLTEEVPADILDIPIRLQLGDAVHMLRAAGFGDPVTFSTSQRNGSEHG